MCHSKHSYKTATAMISFKNICSDRARLALFFFGFFFLSWQIIDALTAHEQQIEAEPGRQMKRSSITNEKKSSPGRFGLCKAKVEVPLKTHLYPPIPGGGRNLAVMGASTSPSNFG